MRTLLLMLGFMIFFSGTSSIAQQMTIKGVPTYRISSIEKIALSNSKQEEYTLLITQLKGGGYIWTSRESKPLNRTESGIYTIFTSPSGMIILRPCFDENKPTGIDFNSGCTKYSEHIRNGLNLISYFGDIKISKLDLIND